MSSVIANLLARINADGTGFQTEMHAVSKSLTDAARTAQKSLEGFDKFGQALTNIGQRLSVAITAPLAAFAGISLKASASLDTLRRGLTATMKSADLAGVELKKLQEIAKLPAIDLEDAVRGSIRLQTLGKSAEESRRIMTELANAVATVGGTKADFSEVIRQLGQMASLGRVTSENLKPILERVPQISNIIKEKFGAAALGDPAETFKKIGVSANQAIKIIVDELAKTERAAGGTANAFENLKAAGTRFAEAVGDSIVKITGLDKRLVALSTELERLAARFAALPASVQTGILSVGAFAAALGPALFIAGQLSLSIVAIGTAVKGLTGLLGVGTLVLGGWVGAVVAGVGAIGTLAYSYFGLRQAQAGAAQAQKDEAGSLIILESKLRSAGVSIDSLALAYKRNEISTDDYLKKLTSLAIAEGNRLSVSRGVVNNLSAEAQAQAKAAAAAERAAEALAGQAAALKALKKEAERQDRIVDANISMLERYDKQAKETVETFQAFNRQTKDVADAQFELKTAFAKAHEGIRGDSLKTVEVLGTTYQTVLAFPLEGLEAAAASASRLTDAFLGLGGAADRAFATVTVAVNRIPAAVEAAVGAAAATAKRLAEAFKEAGIEKIADDESVQRARENFELIAKSGKATAAQLLASWVLYEERRQDLARATGGIITAENAKALEDAKRKLKEVNGEIVKNTSETWEKIKREIDRAFSGMARGMADSIVKWKGFGDTLKSIAQEFASGILEVFIKRLLDPLQKKFEAIIGTVFGDSGGKVGIINNAVSGGGKAVAAGSAGAGGGGAGAAGSSLMGTIGAIGSAVGAVSSVVGNFQQAGMNKSLDLIEHATRFSESHLLSLIGEAQKWWPELGIIRSYLFDNFNPAFASLMSTVEGMAGKRGSNQTIQLVVDGKVLAEALARTLPHHSNAFA